MTRPANVVCAILVGLLASSAVAVAQSVATEEQSPNANELPAPDLSKDSTRHAFTYSVIDAETDRVAVTALIKSDVVPAMVDAGAALYAIWLPTEIPPDYETPKGKYKGTFIGLNDTQLGLMLAWPENDVRARLLDSALSKLDGVKSVITRTFVPIYLADGLRVSTGRGFYLHRFNRYRPKDVPEVVRLSREAWKTFDPKWGTRTIGLFREQLGSDDVAQLLRITFYPSSERWLETRDLTQEPHSRQRFIERLRLLLEGSRIGIATDRLVP